MTSHMNRRRDTHVQVGAKIIVHYSTLDKVRAPELRQIITAHLLNKGLVSIDCRPCDLAQLIVHATQCTIKRSYEIEFDALAVNPGSRTRTFDNALPCLRPTPRSRVMPDSSMSMSC